MSRWKPRAKEETPPNVEERVGGHIDPLKASEVCRAGPQAGKLRLRRNGEQPVLPAPLWASDLST